MLHASAIPSPSTITGKARNTSTIRIRSVSSQPPKNPAANPTTVPTSAASAVPVTPISIDTRIP